MNRIIDIVVEFDVTEQQVAASDRVTPRTNLTQDQQYTDEQLQWYNDLIDTIFDLVENYAGFNIIGAYQSTDIYSYYIEFEAFTESGESLGDFTIRFRISDHIEKAKQRLKNRDSNSALAIVQVMRKRKIFRSIKVNEVSQSGMVTTANTVQHICDELLKGNVEVLDELDR